MASLQIEDLDKQEQEILQNMALLLYKADGRRVTPFWVGVASGLLALGTWVTLLMLSSSRVSPFLAENKTLMYLSKQVWLLAQDLPLDPAVPDYSAAVLLGASLAGALMVALCVMGALYFFLFRRLSQKSLEQLGIVRQSEAGQEIARKFKLYARPIGKLHGYYGDPNYARLFEEKPQCPESLKARREGRSHGT